MNDKYSINQQSINNILSWIDSGEIAIPEIQRPFVWSPRQVRDLMDSLYQGYPIGYIITWQNPSVKLKDGTSSQGKKILIDGQQRITALRAAISGKNIIDKKYCEKRIAISFNPMTEEFKTRTPSTERGAEWISDIFDIMKVDFRQRSFVDEYVKKNSEADPDDIDLRLNRLIQIKNKHIGEIQLSPDLPIEIVNEIFNRINASGVSLSSADFAMSKIAVYEKEPGGEFGMNLRKFIDYFCHLAVAPDQIKLIETNDKKFATTDYFSKINWLRNDLDDLYDPNYTDILRVVSLVEFNRGKLSDFVALLSGRDFKTRENTKEIADESFEKLEKGVYKFTREYRLKRFIQDILRAAGYDEISMLSARNAVNYAYAMYLRAHDLKEDTTTLNRMIRKLFAISQLTGRHSGSFETQFENDIKHINAIGDLEKFVSTLESQEVSDVFWELTLPDEFDKSQIGNPFWHMFMAAQKKLLKDSFLSSENKVAHMTVGDIHHIFPKNYLVKNGFNKSQYNKIANFVYLRTDMNIAISDAEPKEYINKIIETGGYHGDIIGKKDLLNNFKQNAIPESLIGATHEDFEEFTKQRRKLMANMVKEYYYSL